MSNGNGNGGGNGKIVYWILGSVFTVALTLMGMYVRSIESSVVAVDARASASADRLNHHIDDSNYASQRLAALETRAAELERRVSRLEDKD